MASRDRSKQLRCDSEFGLNRDGEWKSDSNVDQDGGDTFQKRPIERECTGIYGERGARPVEWGEDSSEVVGGSGAGGECEGKIRIGIMLK